MSITVNADRPQDLPEYQGGKVKRQANVTDRAISTDLAARAASAEGLADSNMSAIAAQVIQSLVKI